MQKITFLGLLGTVAFLAIVFNLLTCKSKKEFAGLLPETKYIGIEACKNCHIDIYNSYMQTGMGKSFYKPDINKAIEIISPQTVIYDSSLNFYYQPFWQGSDFFIHEFRLQNNDTTYKRTEKISYIIGSGRQTRSYILEKNGYLFEAPITWYVVKQKWDLSPGYDKGDNSRFSRPLGFECIICHNGYPDFVEGTVNKFNSLPLGIDCERCHGPGEAHVKKMQAGETVNTTIDTDYSIINPKRLSTQHQFDICSQCHLEGISVPLKDNLYYRPGTDFNKSFNIFLKQSNDILSFGLASHAERLLQSKCFIESGSKLNCTFCHDPHKSTHVTDKNSYNKACLKCHETNNTCDAEHTKRIKNNDDCISCHIRKALVSNIPHITFTDHYIRVLEKDSVLKTTHVAETKPYVELLCANEKQPSKDIIGRAYLQYFERNAKTDKQYAEIALSNLADTSVFEKSKAYFYLEKYQEAHNFAIQAVEKDSTNTWYLFHYATVLENMNQVQQAMKMYTKILKLNKNVVEAHLRLGIIILNTSNKVEALNQAKEHFEIALLAKPYDETIWSSMGFVSMNQRNLINAEKQLGEALQLNPDYLLALENMVLTQCLKKDAAKAQNYLNRIKKIDKNYNKITSVEAIINRL